MSEKHAIQTDKAAELGGPYSQAIVHSGFIFISGQGAVDPITNQVKAGTIESETRMALENMNLIMTEAGGTLKDILKVSVYLADIKEYGRFNDTYRSFFEEPMPARTCVQVRALPFGLRVEIDAIGVVHSGNVDR